MNGNWYPWSVGSTPDEYILAWRHVHDIFSNKSLDSTRLQWIWSVNCQDSGNYKAEEYWVGENYVDWLGLDGYNWGASSTWSHWKWPNEVFDDMIGRLRKDPAGFGKFFIYKNQIQAFVELVAAHRMVYKKTNFLRTLMS